MRLQVNSVTGFLFAIQNDGSLVTMDADSGRVQLIQSLSDGYVNPVLAVSL